MENSENMQKETYVPPVCEIREIISEGILCQSGSEGIHNGFGEDIYEW